MNEFSQYFCGSQFWDTNLTWNSDYPEFTPCFRETILVWFPCLFLLIFCSYEWHRIAKTQNKAIPWNVVNVTKIILSVILLIQSVTDLIHALVEQYSGQSSYPFTYTTPAIKSVTFIVSTLLLYYGPIKGVVRSYVLFFFWLFLTISGAITYWSLSLMTFTNEEFDGISDDFSYSSRLLFVAIVCLQMFLSLFADSVPEYQKPKNECPEKYASVLSVLTFWWCNPLIYSGYKHSLTKDDLWRLSEENSTRYNARLFNERIKERHSSQFKGIFRSLVKTYWLELTLLAGVKLVLSFLPYVNPIILNLVIDYMADNSSEPDWHGYLYACIMFLSPMVESTLSNQHYRWSGVIALRMRSCLTDAIYKKSLRLSNTGRKDSTVGQIVNLMAIDTQRVSEFAQVINETWSAPLQIAIAFYLLWAQLGVASIAGLVGILILFPINSFITRRLRVIESKLMSFKDKRIKLLNEILSGIKVLKLYAWESSFNDQISQYRDQEIKRLRTRAFLEGPMVFIFIMAPNLVAIISFATYILMDINNILTPKKAFVSLSLCNQMKDPLKGLPQYISWYTMFIVSLKRINKYMSAHEIDPTTIGRNHFIEEAVVVERASFSWTKSEPPILNDISLKVPKQSLFAVVGQVGSGKSSLLQALLGEMVRIEGSVNVSGNIAYVPQQAWIQNATLKQNIIFTNTLNEKRLKEVIENCALTPDLDILPGGVTTEIGEKGINLSGGQKQRVSMARACYTSADLYLLDDPLSALDSNVGKHIFDRVIGPNGMLKDKTRILVTHKISVLSKCDRIIVMKNGSVSEFGSYRQLLESGGHFAELILTHISEGTDEDISEEELQFIDKVVRKDSLKRQQSQSSDGSTKRVQRMISTEPKVGSEQQLSKTKSKEKLSKLTEAEKSETGSVKWSVYWDYIQRMGFIGAFTIFFTYMLSTAFNVSSSQWLSFWSEDSNDPELIDDIWWRNIRLTVYSVLASGEAVTMLFTIVIINLAVLRAARLMHKDMIQNIFRAPMSFFDTTPMGRILNRFARDIDICDTILQRNFRGTFSQVFRALSAFVVIGIETPIVLVVILPIALVYVFIQHLYIPTSRQLKRIESTTRSPVFNHFSETLSGVTNIRASGSVDKFIAESNGRVDINNMSIFCSIITCYWLSFRLEFLGYSMVFVNALYVVISRHSLNSGTAGLTLSYALTITRTFAHLINSLTALETNVVSVERCLEYTNIPSESLWHKPENKPSDNWPSKGSVTFDRYSTRYRDGLDLVLKGISFNIKSGHRVGVVGRTGAGKSSLTLALFRLIESVDGAIRIDGVDISRIGLYDLRSRLTIIPQDPALFTGTLRLNLDPFAKHTDTEIWCALELSHLKSFVASLDSGLNYEVSEGGDNLSVGQKQLICLARALLRKSKIIVMDEATAAVDIETDEVIQQTIRQEFNDCTILTIAHRLNTILDYDRVLVMDKGVVAEYDSPQVLLNDKKSIFYSMAKDSGHT